MIPNYTTFCLPLCRVDFTTVSVISRFITPNPPLYVLMFFKPLRPFYHCLLNRLSSSQTYIKSSLSNACVSICAVCSAIWVRLK